MRTLLVTPFFLFGSIYTVWSNPLTTGQPLQDSTRAQSVYAEYGGASAIYSVNYDTRLSRSNNGWGLRAGIGFLPSQDVNNISVPVQVNYLLGKTRHFFEAGAGATYFHGDLSGSWFSPPEEGSMVFGTLSAGYRYQPFWRGVTARAGGTVLVGSFNNSATVFLPYISVGYRF